MSEDCRGSFHFDCCNRDCGKSFSGDDLARIARRGAKHWNKEHGDELRHRYEAIDEVEFGGHHIQGHSYEVRKYSVYLTSFDMMQRIGNVDGWLVPSDRDSVCPDCYRHIPDSDDRIEDDSDDPFNDEWTCRACIEEAEIERKSNQNQSLGEFVTDGGEWNYQPVGPEIDRNGGDDA